jgi:putative transposase
MGVAVCGNLSVWHGYRWSSAAGHVKGRGDALVAAVTNWRRFLTADEDEEQVERLRRHLRTGRPLGDPAFIARLETRLDRRLHPLKPGPKPKRKR